jgi:hypothetical protein
MYIVFKNGKHFLETGSYPTACAEARKDALRHRMSFYSVWDKETADRKIRGSKDKPLYKINAGMGYTIPNPPPQP